MVQRAEYGALSTGSMILQGAMAREVEKDAQNPTYLTRKCLNQYQGE